MTDIRDVIDSSLRICYRHPWVLLAANALMAAVGLWYGAQVRLDASAQTLAAEAQADVGEYRQFTRAFDVRPFLLVTFAPDPPSRVVSAQALEDLSALQAKLADVRGVASTLSILDVPLLPSPGGDANVDSLSELAAEPRTLRSEGVDLDLAAEELTASPLFAENLISRDGRAAAIRLSLDDEPTDLRALVRRVRDAVDDQQRTAKVHIGGIPLIAADMLAFVQSDMLLFGGAVVVLMAGMMMAFFRKPRWVLMPILTGALSVLLTLGWLGYVDWPVTVVSANFVPIVFILGVSLTVHLMVRFRELGMADNETADLRKRVLDTMYTKFGPCAYTTLTTIIAFASLATSDIQPIVDFGWMVCFGVAFALLVAYTLIPGLLLVLPAPNADKTRSKARLPKQLGRWSTGYAHAIVALSAFLAAIVAVGLPRVQLESRFVDYFDDDTEIHQGLTYIDEQFAGVLPFEIVIEVPELTQGIQGSAADPFAFEGPQVRDEAYWFTRNRLDLVAQIERFVNEQPHVGQTISIHSLEQVAMEFTGGERLTAIQIPLVLNQLTNKQWEQFIVPYANPHRGLLRISGRMRQSSSFQSHHEFEQQLFARAAELGVEEQITLTGMMVLFDNMLDRLLGSQTSSLLAVLAGTLLMFVLLLRSPVVALIGLVPNVLAAGLVISIMGYAGLALDIMTITVAAICIGMGVDDAIHYLHRFQIEWKAERNVATAIQRAHESVGRAMYFTSAAVVVGFSVMVLSNFVPTTRFGVLTAVAMMVVLLANLLLVPSLLVGATRWFGWRNK